MLSSQVPQELSLVAVEKNVDCLKFDHSLADFLENRSLCSVTLLYYDTALLLWCLLSVLNIKGFLLKSIEELLTIVFSFHLIEHLNYDLYTLN